jgi:hypothetical protein
MATTGTGPGSSGTGTTARNAAAGTASGSQQTRDRRAAGDTSARADESSTGGIAQTLRDSTYRSIDDQKTRASDTLGSLAGAVRGMTQPLRDGGQGQIAEYANKAADGIERWASQLRQQDLEDAVRAVEQFARRQPAMFLGLAFGAGLIAARFLKSSSPEHAYRQYGSRFDETVGFGPGGYSSSRGQSSTAMSGGYGASAGSTDATRGARGTAAGDIPRIPSDIRPGEVL